MRLATRLEHAAKAKFDGDLRKVARYLSTQRDFYYAKMRRLKDTAHYERWRGVYQAYMNAQYNTEYWIGVEEEWERDVMDYDPYEQLHLQDTALEG